MAILQTPTRRSKRFLPLATPSETERAKINCSWTDEPIYVRPTEVEHDVSQDEGEEYANGEGYETFFFESFRIAENFLTNDCSLKGARKSLKTKAESLEQTYRVGDTVLIQTNTIDNRKKPPSIAVIISMWDVRAKRQEANNPNRNKMRIRVHWFLRPSELPRIRANREHLESEIYYSLTSTEILFPEVIIGHCNVTSKLPSLMKTTTTKNQEPVSPKKQTRKSKKCIIDDEIECQAKQNNFYCRFAVNSMRGLFFELNWSLHYKQSLEASSAIPPSNEPDWGVGHEWDVTIQASKNRPSNKRRPGKKTKLEDPALESEEDGGTGDEYQEPQAGNSGSDEEDELLLADAVDEFSEEEPEDIEEPDAQPRTPRGKRRRTRRAATTPRKARKTLVHPTPHSRRVMKARGSPRKGKFRMPAQPATYASYDLSHLPQDTWLRAMHVLHVGSRPDALPCREEEFQRVLRCVGELLEEGSGGCIYISGVPGTGKTATVHGVVRELKRMAQESETNPFTYVEINGLKIPEPSAAYTLLWEGVSGHDVAKDGHLNINAKDSLKALTHHFNGGARGPGSHACVVLMDELDQLVTAKQDVVYNFFNWPTLVGSKLIVIAVANTMDLPERVMTGRVRSRLGMIRINFQPYNTQQLEQIVKSRLASAKEGLEKENDKDVIAPDGIKFAAMKVSSITGDARRVLDICRRTVELVAPSRKTARTADVKEVIQAMQNSPTAAYLRDCSFHERLMLASMTKCMKREGIDEIKWSEVQNQHLIYMNVLPSDTDSSRKPTMSELAMVLDSLVAARAMLIEDSAGKPDGERKVLLNLEQLEVERVLSEMGGTVWKSVLST
ncbi:hypothetical protein AX15_001083 [Amanita polypyramis BW_CC]|nr:hypothetical protein AX15_001083 [Amanita polypyramis BW_CC]